MMFILLCFFLKAVNGNDDKPSNKLHYRSSNSIVSECEFDILDKLPIEKSLKREIEDHIVFPTYDASISQVTQKFRRYLFYGYSLEMMKETTRTIACQNNWLFHQIDSSTLLIKFLHGEETSLKNIFEMAQYESQKQNSPFVFMVNEIDQIFGSSSENSDLLLKVRNWLLESFAKIETPNFDNYIKNKGSDFILIFNTRHPTLIDEAFVQRISQKSFFFDFQNLKQFKLGLALRILDIDYKINSFSNFQDRPNDENSKYNEKYTPTYSHNYDYNMPDYNYRTENYYDRYTKQRLKERHPRYFADENNYRPDKIVMPHRRVEFDLENINKNKEDEKYGNSNSAKTLFSNVNNENREFSQNDFMKRRSDIPFKNFNPQELGIVAGENPMNKISNIPNYNRRSYEQGPENSFLMDGSEESSLYGNENRYESTRNSYNPYDLLKAKLKKTRFSSFLQYYGDDYSRYDDSYSSYRGYNYDHERENPQASCVFPMNDEMEIIKKDSLEFGISKRPDELANEKDREEYAELFTTDNILFIRGKTVCVKFDTDFEDFIKDHCIPWKYNEPDTENLYYNRPGFTFEDAKSIVKLTMNKFLNNKALGNETGNEKENDYFADLHEGNTYGVDPYNRERQEKERKWIENEFIFTASSIKVTLLNYLPISTLEEANAILKWSSMHQYIRAHIQYLSSKLSEAFLVPQKKEMRMMRKRYNYSEVGDNGVWSNVDDESEKNRRLYEKSFELPNPEQEIKSPSLSSTLNSLDSQISSLDSRINTEKENSGDVSLYLDKSKLLSFIATLKKNLRKKEKLRYWAKLQSLKAELQTIQEEKIDDPNNKMELITKLASIEKTLKEIRDLKEHTEETESKDNLTRDIKEAMDEVEENPQSQLPQPQSNPSSFSPFLANSPILYPIAYPSK